MVVVNVVVNSVSSCGRKPARALASVLGILGIALLFASCATSDDPYSVSVKNDFQRTVTLAICDSHDCSKRVDPWVLRPGQDGAVNVEVNGGYNPAIVLDSDGTVVGCLPLRLSTRPQPNLTVRASQAIDCGRSAGAETAHGKDWPDPNI